MPWRHGRPGVRIRAGLAARDRLREVVQGSVQGALDATEEAMNRTELTRALARSTGLSRADAARAVEGLFDPRTGVIARALRRHQTVRIKGFGTFLTRRRAARLGRDPRTGEPIRIPAGTSVGFRPGRPLRETLG